MWLFKFTDRDQNYYLDISLIADNIKIIPSNSITLISYENVERCDDFFVDVSGTIEDFTGDVLTWSAFNKFRQINGDEKAMEMFEKFGGRSNDLH